MYSNDKVKINNINIHLPIKQPFLQCLVVSVNANRLNNRFYYRQNLTG